MVTVNLGGREWPLYYNTKAMRDIEKRCGALTALADWMNEGGVADRIERVGMIIADLINGGIYKANAEIALGLADGEKQSFVDPAAIAALIDPHALADCTGKIYAAFGADIPPEIPEGIVLTEEDPDLAEVEAARREREDPEKNAVPGQAPGIIGFYSVAMPSGCT